MNSIASGLIILCLISLAGCSSGQRLPEPVIITSGSCPEVKVCTLRAAKPAQNNDLEADLERAIEDWALCAAQIDELLICQENDRAKTR
ncbi:Rz1-like lysis system protein LysC [Nitrincola iocasae]|uniref:Rz1-like lysis system protein LysC n=1 Tax=Nitrincola iocasae TaxID=2614693 RepID=UPI0038993C98